MKKLTKEEMLLEEISVKVTDLRNENIGLDSENKELQVKIEDIRANYQKSKEELEMAQKKAKEFAEKRDVLRIEVDNLDDKTRKLRVEYDALKKDIEESEAVKAELEKSINELTRSDSEVKAEIKADRERNERTAKSLKELADELELKQRVLNKRETLLSLKESAK